MSVDLLETVGSIARIKNFVRGDLAQHLGQLDMSAAANAVSEAAHAKDERFVLYSAINHLQSAEEKYRHMLSKTSSKSMYVIRIIHYIHALKALLYRYFGENNLVCACLQKTIQDNELFNHPLTTIEEITFGWNLKAWVNLFSISRSEISKATIDFDAAAFWRVMGYDCEESVNLRYLQAFDYPL